MLGAVLVATLAAGLIVTVRAGGGATPGALAAPSGLDVLPFPDTEDASPKSQISFPALIPSQLRTVIVRGSRSGVHRGRMVADSDGEGVSFLPDKPFAVGETVTVSTGLNVLGARNGRFSFAIANVAPRIPNGKLGGIPVAAPHGVMDFRSRPDLRPASVIVTQDAAAASGGDTA